MESEMKWTPGPWKSVKSIVCPWPDYVEAESDHKLVAVIQHGNTAHECEVTLATARLVAAAPDLYEALAGLLTGHPSGDNEAQKIGRAALAKARGES